MSFLSHLISHSYPCNAATCPIVTGRPSPEPYDKCECCELSDKESSCERDASR